MIIVQSRRCMINVGAGKGKEPSGEYVGDSRKVSCQGLTISIRPLPANQVREPGLGMSPQEKPTGREEVMLALNAKFAVMRKLYGVKKIGLFGSVARGEERPGSDLDIEVEFETGMDTYQNFIGLTMFLDENLGRPVDLVMTRVLASYLRPELGAEFAVLSRDSVYLGQILDEISYLSHRTHGITARDFQKDETLKRAVLRSMEVIGEAAGRISGECRRDTAAIPWKELEGLKTRLVHPYFSPDWGLVWNVLNVFLPSVEQSLRKLHARMSH
ncbi:MAG: HepT-like ribonuclease domain-containing protein [Methanolinea sp.]